MQRQIAEVAIPAVSQPVTSSEPDILTRLKPHNRGALVRLSVEDHYTDVVTTLGHELILLRFADALKELGGTPGLQVHRSHWIAVAHVDKLKRDNGKLFVVMKDGTEIPVSRPNLETVRNRFASL
jgi:DNA-binding LytR/AlgR family response regulator